MRDADGYPVLSVEEALEVASDPEWLDNTGELVGATRALAAEVERLRAELDDARADTRQATERCCDLGCAGGGCGSGPCVPRARLDEALAALDAAQQPWGAAEILARIREDPLADAADVKPERPSVQSGSPNASQVDPVDLDTLTGWVEAALESSDIEVEVREADGTVSPLRRLVRSLRSAGLLDEGDSIPVCALRALAQGEPPGEVSDDYGVPAAVVRAVLPLVGRA